MHGPDEIVESINLLKRQFEDLVVRGIRSTGAEHLNVLRGMQDEFDRIGATHLAGQMAELTQAIEADDPAAPKALLQAQTSLRLFERLLTLEVAEGTLAAMVGAEEEELDDDEEDHP